MKGKENVTKPEGYVFGRPTSYKPEYCEKVIELGKQGDSLAQMASFFDVTRSTIDEWAKNNPDFSEALSRAKAHCQAWWEKEGRDGLRLGGGGFNAAVWKKSMEARFREDYTERKEVHQTGSMEHKHSLGDLTDEELAHIATAGRAGASSKT